MPSVFLSYRQVNRHHVDHKQRVREFALRLRHAGVTVILDQLADEEEFNSGGPSCENGWAGWSYAQVETADKILIIGSHDYYTVYEGKEIPGVGLGAGIEAHRIFTKLYSQRGRNERFRAVILTDEDLAGIPDHFSDFSHFNPNRSEEEFARLIRWLIGGDSKEPASEERDIWPASLSGYTPDLANRDIEFGAFVTLLTGHTKERALFFEAPGNRGKTTLVRECMAYARALLGPDSCITIDFNADASKQGVLDSLRLDLASQLPNFSRSVGTTFDLRSDLRALRKPTVILFDTYEKAGPDARELIASIVLRELDKLNGVRLVVAGREVPDHQKAIWSPYAAPFQLSPIDDPEYWTKLAKVHYPGLKAEHIIAITLAAAGDPGSIRAGLQAVAFGLSGKEHGADL